MGWFCSVGSSLLHLCHDRIFVGMESYQCIFAFQRHCRWILSVVIAGENHPIIWDTLVLFEKSTPLVIVRVDGKVVADVNQNELRFVLHSIPTTLVNLLATGISSWVWRSTRSTGRWLRAATSLDHHLRRRNLPSWNSSCSCFVDPLPWKLSLPQWARRLCRKICEWQGQPWENDLTLK